MSYSIKYYLAENKNDNFDLYLTKENVESSPTEPKKCPHEGWYIVVGIHNVKGDSFGVKDTIFVGNKPEIPEHADRQEFLKELFEYEN